MSESSSSVLALVPPAEVRTRNVSGKERCRYCLNSGYVTVQMRGEFEEMGPCPFCERGFAEEFPDYSRCTKADPVRSPWGEDGFWKGRESVELQPLESADPEPLSREVVLGYLARFTGRTEWDVFADPDDEQKEKAA